jgi:thioredoxin 1
MPVSSITDATFEGEVLSSGTPVLVDFWAPWCRPCHALAPILDEIAEEHAGSIKVVKIDTDENPEAAERYRVSGLPTIAVFIGGELVQSVVGAQPKSSLLEQLEPYLFAQPQPGS